MFERGVVEEVRSALAGRRVAHRREDARARRDRASRPREALERDRRPDAPLRGVPAQVDASDPGRRARRRKPASGRRRGGDPRAYGRLRAGATHDPAARGQAVTAAVRPLSSLRARCASRSGTRSGTRTCSSSSPTPAPSTPERVRRLCDGDTGIGSDGVLEVTARDGAHAVVRIWNPDGSTAELSGNGDTHRGAPGCCGEDGRGRGRDRDRGSASYVRPRASAEGIVTPGPRRRSRRRRRGPRRRRRAPDDRPGRRRQPARRRAPIRRCRATTCFASAPRSRRIPGFPDRTNVQLAAPEPRDVVSVLVWERGAGETPASGIVRRRRRPRRRRARLVRQPVSA